ncbi:MAG TPA: SMC family ATPase, partial [Deinococcales bacterium]|nr:SMC family ATPase [Deinococcales bacterium]
MKPLKLQMTGFTCFRETQFLDFSDLELFAIQGPTGAGKSSILDAMTYALYGETPRLGAQGLQALVSQGASQMQVMYEFEVPAHGRFRVTRVWSVKASEKQTRLERWDGQWVNAVEGTSIAEVNAAIRNLLGLDFDGFTRAVLLPQGRFDEFLRGDKAKRRELLKSLLNLQHIENMRAAANARAAGLQAEAQHLEQTLQTEYADATPERREELTLLQADTEAELLDAGDKLGAAREAVQALRDLRDKAQAARAAAEDLARREREAAASRADERRLAEAQRAAPVVPLIRNAQQAATAREGAARNAETADRKLETALSALDDAQAAHAQAEQTAASENPKLERQLQEVERAEGSLALLQAHGGDLSLAPEAGAALDVERLAALAGLDAPLGALSAATRREAQASREVDTQHRAVTRAGRVMKELKADLDACVEEGKALRERAEAAREALERAQRDDHLAALVQGLQPGDPCPVCGKPLKAVPEGQGGADLNALRAEEREAADALTEKRGQHHQIKGRLEAEQATLEREEKLLAERQKAQRAAEREAAEALEPIAAVIGAADDPAREAAARKREQLAALAAEIVAVTGGTTPQAARQRLRKQLQDLDRAVNEAQERVSTLSGSLEGLRQSRETAWEFLQVRAEEL